MSRIKDLLAEEENIDDLKVPVRFGKEFGDFITKVDNKRIAETVLAWARTPQVEDFIADNAIFGLGDDDGQPCMFLENFTMMCDEIAIDTLDRLIEQEHYNLSDEEYADIVEHASNLIADYYADYEDALCLDAFVDYERDSKYANDELRERNGQC
jgi:hypothetical protein